MHPAWPGFTNESSTKSQLAAKRGPAAQLFSPGAVRLRPPLTEEAPPLAVLTNPLTQEATPEALLAMPPLTEAKSPLISLKSPTTKPPKLEKLFRVPTTTLWEPVRTSSEKRSSL